MKLTMFDAENNYLGEVDLEPGLEMWEPHEPLDGRCGYASNRREIEVPIRGGKVGLPAWFHVTDDTGAIVDDGLTIPSGGDILTGLEHIFQFPIGEFWLTQEVANRFFEIDTRARLQNRLRRWHRKVAP